MALEIGCGAGFWLRKHLLPSFGQVHAVDVIPEEWVWIPKKEDRSRLHYHEAGERDYQAAYVLDESIDFVWSFGCFCHLSLESINWYLHTCWRVMKPGAVASLYFSCTTKRPVPPLIGHVDPNTVVGWTENDLPTTLAMLRSAGFTDITEVLEHGKDTMLIVRKPVFG